MKSNKLTLLGACSLLLASTSSAVVVVDFTNSVSGSLVAAAGQDVNVNGSDVWNFDDVNPAFDGTAAGSNTRIFGGLTTTWGGGGGYAVPFRLTGSSAGTLLMQVNPSNITGLNTMAGILVWQKANFLSGAALNESIQFNSGGSLSINFSAFHSSAAPATTSDIRFVVQKGGNYYVSSSSKADLTLGTFSIDPSLGTWAQVNTSDYTFGSFSSLALTDIQSVGVYVNMSRTGGQLQVAFNDFQADATVIPEPSTYAALAGLGALGLVTLRRRK